MPDDGEDAETQIALRRLQGTRLGEAYAEVMRRIEDEPASITVPEWRSLTDKFMCRPEVLESFHTVLEWFVISRHTQITFLDSKSGKSRIIKVVPGMCRSFVKAWQQYAAVDSKVLLLDKLRDPVMYAAFVLAGTRQPRSETARTVVDIGV